MEGDTKTETVTDAYTPKNKNEHHLSLVFCGFVCFFFFWYDIVNQNVFAHSLYLNFKCLDRMGLGKWCSPRCPSWILSMSLMGASTRQVNRGSWSGTGRGCTCTPRLRNGSLTWAFWIVPRVLWFGRLDIFMRPPHCLHQMLGNDGDEMEVVPRFKAISRRWGWEVRLSTDSAICLSATCAIFEPCLNLNSKLC